MKLLTIIFAVIVFFGGTATASNDCWDNMMWDNGYWYVGAGGISGNVAVNVFGQEKINIANAYVTLEGTEFSATSDLNGQFIIENVPEGAYDMHLIAPGFETVSMQVYISDGQVSFFNDLQMTLEPCRNIMDVNENNKIDLADIIYGLQVLTGLQN